MKKLIAMLLCLMMMLPAAFAEVDESPALSLEEMETYLGTLLQQVKDEGCQITEENGVYTAAATFGDVVLSNNVLSDETQALGVTLSPEQADLRGLKAGDSLDMIFQLYPNDNQSLTGTYYEATLSFRGSEPEICLGYLLRDGQRVKEVTYAVYNWQADGIVKCGVTYTMDQGYIQQVTLFTADTLMTAEEVETEISESAMLQEVNEYFAYPTSLTGTDLDPFCREDLAFAGMDFYSLTPDQAIQALGAAQVDEWTPDSDGTFIRLMQWNGVSAVFKYTKDKQFQSVYSFSVNDDVLEGPRGLRIGDYMDTVLYRFRHSEGTTSDLGILLYGDGENAPYGLITYGTDTNTMSYTVSLDGQVCMLYLTFSNDALVQMQLFMNK